MDVQSSGLMREDFWHFWVAHHYEIIKPICSACTWKDSKWRSWRVHRHCRKWYLLASVCRPILSVYLISYCIVLSYMHATENTWLAFRFSVWWIEVPMWSMKTSVAWGHWTVPSAVVTLTLLTASCAKAPKLVTFSFLLVEIHHKSKIAWCAVKCSWNNAGSLFLVFVQTWVLFSQAVQLVQCITVDCCQFNMHILRPNVSWE